MAFGPGSFQEEGAAFQTPIIGTRESGYNASWRIPDNVSGKKRRLDVCGHFTGWKSRGKNLAPPSQWSLVLPSRASYGARRPPCPCESELDLNSRHSSPTCRG